MKPMDREENFPSHEELPLEVAFSIIDSESDCGAFLSRNNTGTLIDLDSNGISLLTRTPIQPGNIVRLDHRGTSKLGVVMWSVESPDNCRVQVRFI